MRKPSYFWLAAVGGVLAAFVVATLVLPRSFGLTAISDIVQCFFLFSGAAAFVPLALAARGRMRLFWSLIALGISFWLLYQLLWTYIEVVLRRDVPDLFAGDVILFLHIVPLMAAIALRPHVARDEYAARVGRLDFALLLVWWFYLYVLVVIPWQYVVADVAAYNKHLNAVYVSEEIAFLVGLVLCWMTSKGLWRNLYAGLFGMSLCYAASSTVMNWAIGRQLYYSGSLYDIPYVAAMAWLTWIGLRTNVEKPATDARKASTLYGVWIARCSMIAVFSLPLFAAWAMSDGVVPARVRLFRLALTLVAAFFMGMMVLRATASARSRTDSTTAEFHRQSFDSLKQLQAQLLQSEKLASIGQLVGGVAHELNNPDYRHARLLRHAAQHLAHRGAAAPRCKDRPVCPPYQVAGRQLDQLRQAYSGAQKSSRSQHLGAHRRQVDPNSMGNARHRSAHPVRSGIAQSSGGFQSVAASLSSAGRKLPARAQRPRRPSPNLEHRKTSGHICASNRHRTHPSPFVGRPPTIFDSRRGRRPRSECLSGNPAGASR